MKSYFAYTRVSDVKQVNGASLDEQRAAISAYARKHDLRIVAWFEEQQTAAKQGRPVFTQVLKSLRRQQAAGVIVHKIDRSARNLRDWAALGDLLDAGVELHFAHESLDLASRGGRLAADIQAIVAADFIRNLRDETRKGFYGRLRQGLYPLKAPIGYLDNGKGKPKTIDPVRGPLVARGFELYATGAWTLETLGNELFAQGLRAKKGGRVTRNGISTMLNSAFYIGLMRIEKTGEVFPGIHERLIPKSLYDDVQRMLQNKTTHRRVQYHRFRYQKLLHCASCGRTLSASTHKGFVYYRCHTAPCPTTCLREERIDHVVAEAAGRFRLSQAAWLEMDAEIEAYLTTLDANRGREAQWIALAIAAADDRLTRLTDAYLDGAIDKATFERRKAQHLNERLSLEAQQRALENGESALRTEIETMFELLKGLGNKGIFGNDEKIRDLLKRTTSNLEADGKNVAIKWRMPFGRFVFDGGVPVCDLDRIKFRTLIVEAAAENVRQIDESTTPPASIPKRRNPGARNIEEFNRRRAQADDESDLRPAA